MIHVGPMVECTTTTITRTTEYLVCFNISCDKFNETVYFGAICNHCGHDLTTKTKSISVPTIEREDVRQALNYLMEKISPIIPNINKHYWICDYGQCFPSEDDIGHNQVWNQVLNYYQPENLTSHFEDFKKSFSKELDILNKIYGQDNVKVHWAVCAYTYT